MGGSRRSLAGAVLPGTVVAATLTAWRSSTQPVWRDEWITWSVTVRPLASMAQLLAQRDGGLWAFYAGTHAWVGLGRLVGLEPSVAWVRAPAALATVLAVAAAALVGRRVGGSLAGALAGVLLALVPAVVDHAQEARAYPEVVAAVTLTALAALRCREAPGARRTAALTVLAALAVAAHPLPGVPAVAGILAATLVSPGAASRRRVALAALPAALVGAVLVAVGVRQVGLVLTDAPGGWATIAGFRLVLAPGWPAFAAMVALAAVGAAWLRHRDRGAALLLGAWALAPPAMLSVLLVSGSFSTRRYLVAGAPAACVLVAVGAVALGRAAASWRGRGRPDGGLPSAARRLEPAVALAAVGALVVGLVPHAVAARTAPYRVDDPRSAARFLAASYRGGDAVAYAGPFARGLVTFYAPATPRLPDDLLAEPALGSATVNGVDLPPPWQAAAVAGASRVWTVATRAGPVIEGQDVVDRVTAGRQRLGRETFGAVLVELWGPAHG